VEQPLYHSVNQALYVHQSFIARLLCLVAWAFFAIAHLAVVVIAFFGLWVAEITPSQVTSVVTRLLHGAAPAWFSAFGGSLATVIIAYGWLLRKMYRHSGAALSLYLTKDL